MSDLFDTQRREDEITFRLRDDQPEPLSREALRRIRDWEGEDPATVLIDSARTVILGNYLDRYCRGDMDGFSVLLAGQRGAGKTTLVKLAIERAMIKTEHLIPLPVFLHGPTVIDPLASEKKKEPELGDKAASVSPTVVINIGGGNRPAPAPQAPREDEYEAAREAKANGLPKIMTSLYRSLSDAICDAWRNAALYSPYARRNEEELLEMAAQLDRLLDMTPGPEPLRKLWARAGFLRDGVAFYLRGHRPFETRRRERPARASAGTIGDQGIREIIALAACADVFRGVISKSSKETWRSNLSSEQRRQSGPPPSEGKKEKEKEQAKNKEEERKETGAKVGPAAVGGLAGLAALQAGGGAHDGWTSLLPALLLGAVAWSVSWLAWNYAATRATKQALERESVTEIDWGEIRVLERRFPALIRRVKDAGFAPIFIFDELDKMVNPMERLDNFLRLTKHIVTDEAVFFFLVNRSYFEKVEFLEREAPPRAATSRA